MNTNHHDTLTRTQHDTLRFIERYIQEHVYAPSFREMAIALHVSPSSAFVRVQQLVRLGRIQRDPMISRGIRVLHGTDREVHPG